MAQPNPISVLHDLKDAHVHHHMDRSSRTRHGQPGHSGNLIHVNCMNVSQMSSQHKDMSSRRRNGQPSHSGNLIHANCMNVSQMSSHHKDISSRRRHVQPSDYGHVFLSPAKQKRKRQSNDEEIKQVKYSSTLQFSNSCFFLSLSPPPPPEFSLSLCFSRQMLFLLIC